MHDLGRQDGDALGKGRVSWKMASLPSAGDLWSLPSPNINGLPGPCACPSKTSLLLPCLFPHVPHMLFSDLSPPDGACRFLLCQGTPSSAVFFPKSGALGLLRLLHFYQLPKPLGCFSSPLSELTASSWVSPGTLVMSITGLALLLCAVAVCFFS